MTKQDYTALVFVVDRSGSMQWIARDMEGGISTLLDTQKGLPGKLTVDFVRFDNEIEHVSTLADPADVDIKIDPRGSTALYDAVGKTISVVGSNLAALPEDERPDKVIFAIVTDGHENASREFSAKTVSKLVERQTSEYNWTFTYLGANQDAVLTAKGLGITADNALTYNTQNVGAMAQTFDSYVTNTRSGINTGYTNADRKANR